MRRVKSISIFTLVLLALIFSFSVGARYIPNNKDTHLPPEEVEIVIEDPKEFQLLKETENYDYYFKDERDVIAIVDKRTGYLWKTGIDVPFALDVYDACDNAGTMEEKIEACINVENRLNAKFTGMANSLVTVEFYDNTNQINFISSASIDNAHSELKAVVGDDSHYILEVRFTKPKIQLKVHVYFTDKGISYEIRHHEISGDEKERIASILITPFLGAEGGQYLKYDFDKDEYPMDSPIRKEHIPGYVLVPDGSGALIRFNDYDTQLSMYTGRVYGTDQSLRTMYYSSERGFVSYKQPVMPVFGIAHGNRQAAFVAYATTGDEQMEIIMSPDEQRNMSYNFAYPRFIYNAVYFQIYNQAGSGYNKQLDTDQKPVFDINMHYEFLSGDGEEDGKPADYVGMAKAYRNHLLETGIIQDNTYDYNDIPTRIDFIMSDAKRNIIGFDDVVVTHISDVEAILKDLHASGIQNVNSGLIGYQKGGLTLGKPNKIKYTRSIGTRKEFEKTISALNQLGIDVSLHQDFVTINEEQMNLRGNALRHATNWYTRLFLYDAESPINTVYYARANKSSAWLTSHLKALKKIKPNSITIDGIQNILYSDYTNSLRSRQMVIDMYQNSLDKASKNYMINAKNPNQYTWEYIDRYLESPVFSSQFIVETDTVPFLQLVLNGSMEMYAPYSNFSFYTDKDILRMIDYNVYPSFVLTKEPAHLLMATNSANYYSTEYDLYKPLIDSIYSRVNEALDSVINEEWVDRTVVENGVIVNRYQNGNEIVINYTDDVITYKGEAVSALSYKVIK